MMPAGHIAWPGGHRRVRTGFGSTRLGSPDPVILMPLCRPTIAAHRRHRHPAGVPAARARAGRASPRDRVGPARPRDRVGPARPRDQVGRRATIETSAARRPRVEALLGAVVPVAAATGAAGKAVTGTSEKEARASLASGGPELGDRANGRLANAGRAGGGIPIARVRTARRDEGAQPPSRRVGATPISPRSSAGSTIPRRNTRAPKRSTPRQRTGTDCANRPVRPRTRSRSRVLRKSVRRANTRRSVDGFDRPRRSMS